MFPSSVVSAQDAGSFEFITNWGSDLSSEKSFNGPSDAAVDSQVGPT